jgi:hypothetical protein
LQTKPQTTRDTNRETGLSGCRISRQFRVEREKQGIAGLAAAVRARLRDPDDLRQNSLNGGA